MLRLLERALLLAGAIALGLFSSGFYVQSVQATQVVSEFKQTKTLRVTEPDMTLWSTERIQAYQQDRSGADPAIGVLSIERLDIEAPVFSGSTDQILDRGVAWIQGTAQLGKVGNTGLAAHRDGFFRGLKDIQIGDDIRISTLADGVLYKVTATDIVSPQDVYVLDPTKGATLTLITCYPFYYVGSAPSRFVVYAVATEI